MRRVLVVNGPNLNMLGTRRPEVYGSTTLPELDERCRAWGARFGLEVDTFQSNHEGALIDRVQATAGSVDGLVVNLGAFTHSSYALHDAIEAVGLPAVEVHISNIKEREPWRRNSVIAPACVYQIYGRGIVGYRHALSHLASRWELPVETRSYGTETDQVADLRLPEQPGPHPVAVLLHGGFFRHEWTRDLFDGVAVDLAQRGVATWNVEYRRVGAGGGYPATLLDTRRAVDALEGVDAPLDLGRVALVGHSTGGFLAVWAASQRRLVSVVASLAGFADLASAEDLGHGSVRGFLAEVDPDTEDATPLRRLPFGARHLVAHGTADDLVPIAHGRHHAAAASEAGDPVELIELEGAGHFELLERSGPTWGRIAPRITAALTL
jgi:3-dehydroquinate dehydratase-2